VTKRSLFGYFKASPEIIPLPFWTHVVNPRIALPHRVLIKLPNGFEFNEAEMASGSTTIKGGAVSFAPLKDSHGHFAHLHLTGKGVVREAVVAR
jgi:hypothetical protein